MSRHPYNINLHLYHGTAYAGMPVMFDKGPFILECLDTLDVTIKSALNEYSRVFAFRVDLRHSCRWLSTMRCIHQCGDWSFPGFV